MDDSRTIAVFKLATVKVFETADQGGAFDTGDVELFYEQIF